MPEQIPTAVRVEPDRTGPPVRTGEAGAVRRWRRPVVQRRVFTGEDGSRSVQWGIRDVYGTWVAHPDQPAAFAAAFSEYAA